MKSISKLKKELDKWFSLYIRLRDATDEGAVICVTCNKVGHYKSGMQCGHFQSRRHHATRWNEKNCAVQCIGCNCFKQGEQFRFSIYIDSKYGEGAAEYLEGLARTTVKFSRIDYEEKISYYKLAVENLKKLKGIN
tara:strand:- start:17713 stop:18120 length:408 start_codon:yes stop_codon:yes gene_type:complete